MPLGEYMRRHTHLEHLVWVAFFEQEWDRPSRSDYYLMQVAFRAWQAIAREPERLTLDDCRLKFRQAQSQEQQEYPPEVAGWIMTPERMIEARKAEKRALAITQKRRAP